MVDVPRSPPPYALLLYFSFRHSVPMLDSIDKRTELKLDYDGLLSFPASTNEPARTVAILKRGYTAERAFKQTPKSADVGHSYQPFISEYTTDFDMAEQALLLLLLPGLPGCTFFSVAGQSLAGGHCWCCSPLVVVV